VTLPRVSIVLPVRNGERFLGAAVESILTQTLGELELLVVDDGSTDGTAQIVAGVNDERLRVLRQEPRGLVEALTLGIAASVAPYVARMDADDLSFPQRLEHQLALLEARPDVGLVASWVVVVDEEGRELERRSLPEADRDLRRRLLLRNPFQHGSVTIRREAFDHAGGYRADYGHNEDYDLWRRIARRWRLAVVPEFLYAYRLHSSAVTRVDPDRIALREVLRDELWRERSLVCALGGETDRAEARALAREALRRTRPALAARTILDALRAR
jgi:glycosyltransferase involved in cell wall biosynthesis